MLDVCYAGLAPGTWKNKSAQVRRYITYAGTAGFDPRRPDQYDILSYLLHLKESLASPGAALNYISGAKTWVLLMGGAHAAFDSYPTSLMKRGIRRSSTHVPRPAPPLTKKQLHDVVAYVRSDGPAAEVIAAALLIGFATLLRQGNLLGEAGPGAHALAARDLVSTPAGLQITVMSTKTRWRSSPSTTIWIPRGATRQRCPVAAWDSYASATRPHPSGPAFVLPSGAPLLPLTLVTALRLSLGALGTPEAESFSLHSLRRGGAQAYALAGCSLGQIKALGTWSSDAVLAYVPQSMVD